MLEHRLPPLELLIIFEAAARYLSFTSASKELHLSQAAVSQRIRQLELYLEVKLFNCSHRAVRLTDAGRKYQHAVSGLLKQLATVTTDIKSSEIRPRLSLACDQSFAAFWPGYQIFKLFDENVFPVCSPEYGYYLIINDRYAEERTVCRFKQWLLNGFNMRDECRFDR